MDADADDQPDDLNGDGSFMDEVKGLNDPDIYAPEATFWRVSIDHFTPIDCNWPFGPPSDAIYPNPDGAPGADTELYDNNDCRQDTGSFVEERSRIFHEDIPIPGTEIVLHYSSNRAGGYSHVFTIPASGNSIPTSLKRITVEVEIAGRTLEQTLSALPDQKAEIVWDGNDYFGRPVEGLKIAHVSIGYVYDYGIYMPANLAQSFGQAGTGATFVSMRSEGIIYKRDTLTVPLVPKTDHDGLQNWSLSTLHYLNPQDISTLHKGDGTIKTNKVGIMTTIAGNGTRGFSGDGGPAIDASFKTYLYGPVIDSEGNLFISDHCNHRVRKVDTDGTVTTVAGGGSYTYDGIPATEAALSFPAGIDIDDSGNLYIADTMSNSIRMVDQDGIFTTFAGNGSSSYNGNGIPATEVGLAAPKDVCVDAYGNVFIADTYNHCIRKVDPTGTITTVAGVVTTSGYSGDGGLAINAVLDMPESIYADSYGNLYIADSGNHCIRKVDSAGVITTVAGIGGEYSAGYSGDGGPAVDAELNDPTSVITDTTGSIYIADSSNHRIRKVNTDGIIETVAGIGTDGISDDGLPSLEAQLRYPNDMAIDLDGNLYLVDTQDCRVRIISPPLICANSEMDEGDLFFAEDNSVGHIFSGTGLHKATIDLDTGVTIREFGYDEDDNLISSTDQFGNQTTINRYGDAMPESITSPDGVTTQLTADIDNNLTHITYPNGSVYEFEYTIDGLLTAKIEPAGNRFEHSFDDYGRLTDATDDEGGHWSFTREAQADGDILTEVLTGEGNLTTYLDHTDSTGAYTSTITDPTGAQTLFVSSADGLTVNKSLPCGMDMEFTYDLDPEYKFKFIKEIKKTTPSNLERITLREKTYTDTDSDDVADLISATINVNGKATIIENNVLQSQKIVTSPEGRTITVNYNPANLLVESIVVPDLFDTVYEYDSKGRPTSVLVNTRQTNFTYDSNGNLETVTDPLNHTTSYGYDQVGRLTSMNRPDAGDLFFAYDANGNMTILTNPSNVDHTHTFNGVNLPDSYQTPLSGNYQYFYDADRRLITTTFPSGKEINNIYTTTQLTQVQTPEGNIDYTYVCTDLVDTVSKGSESIAYTYDGSLPTSMTYSGTLNQGLSYTYNNDFFVNSVSYAGATESYAYDQDNMLTGAGDYTITRNAQNGLADAVSGGSLNIDRTFNGYGEISNQTVSVNGSSAINWTLTRDNAGRITSKTETVNGVTDNYIYAYDSMGRLETVTKDSSVVESYGYDLNGTRISETNTLRGITRTLSYNDEDHLLTAGSATYTYDLDGFLTGKADGADSTIYDYSSRGELLQVNLPNGDVITYDHDPLGRRIVKRINGTITEKYLWQSLTTLLAIYDGSDNLVQRFEYADDRMPVAMAQGGVTYHLAYDQVGSLRVVTDSAGNVIKQVDYDAFGNILADSNSAFTVPFGFAGGLHDRDTGLVRFGYRDYDPDTGRWTAKDPIGFAGGDTDLFGYCQNNPVNLVDPYGLYDWASEAKGQALSVTTTVATVAAENAGIIGSNAALGLTFMAAPLGDLIFPNSTESYNDWQNWIYEQKQKAEKYEQQEIWDYLNSPEVKALIEKLKAQQRKYDEMINEDKICQ